MIRFERWVMQPRVLAVVFTLLLVDIVRKHPLDSLWTWVLVLPCAYVIVGFWRRHYRETRSARQ